MCLKDLRCTPGEAPRIPRKPHRFDDPTLTSPSSLTPAPRVLPSCAPFSVCGRAARSPTRGPLNLVGLEGRRSLV
ncbi:hypothetical protein E2C01_053017 [Portunus trituberculatus]|uniref:Uncharacterized protein n=1 Tax=Portunus trituberculatus TaxID=210409 RepID=A0A5B7GJ80_PORTR|nr:hypothetical protein [Portunus trituberculatus]